MERTDGGSPEQALREPVIDFREEGHTTIDWVADFLARVDGLPVMAQIAPGELSSLLPASPPASAEPFSNVLRDVDELIVPASTHFRHRRFFGYFPATATEPGILAELLAATLNQPAIAWRASPASTELELRTVDWVKQMLGLPQGWHGHIEDTASTSTLAALAAGRETTGRNVVVASEHAHSSVEKATRILGMEYRQVPTDASFSMRPEALEADDAAVVVPTVGTTSFGSVDPIYEIGQRAKAAGAWLHVDAAYAGSAWICEETRWSQRGIELADSLVVNAHKWLMTPMDCSLLWSSRPEALREAFSVVPEYLKTPEDVFALSAYGPAFGRRFRSLKLWAVIRCYGRRGLEALIRGHIRLAQLFAGWVREAPGWELCSEPHFGLVVFRRHAADDENERLLEQANATGEVFLSHTRLDGHYVLRLAIGQPGTSESDIRHAWDLLQKLCCSANASL